MCRCVGCVGLGKGSGKGQQPPPTFSYKNKHTTLCARKLLARLHMLARGTGGWVGVRGRRGGGDVDDTS